MNTFTLGPGEQTIAIFRKHPVFLWLSGAKYIILALIPPLAMNFVSSYIDLGNFGQAAFIFYLIVLWVMFFVEWTNFMLDTWILTNERLVDVDQVALFSRRVSTLSLDRIQDVTIQQMGLLDSFLGIGTIFIQTAGTAEEFKIRGMRNPVEVKDILVQAYQSNKERVFEKIADLR